MLYMRGKRGGIVLSDRASNVDWKKTSHPTLWQRFKRTLPHCSTPGIFSRISFATLRTVRSLSTTPISSCLSLNVFFEVEELLSEREGVHQDTDKIKRPNTKWVFVGFSSVEVRVVIDWQPLLGAGPLPDWLRNLVHGQFVISGAALRCTEEQTHNNAHRQLESLQRVSSNSVADLTMWEEHR